MRSPPRATGCQPFRTGRPELCFVTNTAAQSDFDLAAHDADRLWPDYRQAFREETERLASIGIVGE